MIDSVPLIQNPNDAQQINASIIAMKKASKELDEKILKLNNLNKELDKKIAVIDSGLAQEITDRENADNAEATNRNTAITNAVNSLDVASVGGSGKYISAISETDGKINATASDLATEVTSGNSQPVTSGGVAEAIDAMSYDFSYYVSGEETVFVIEVPYTNASNTTSVGSILINARYGYKYILDFYAFINESSLSTTANRVAKVKMTDGAYSNGNYLETILKWDVDTTNRKIKFYLKKSDANTRINFKVLQNYKKRTEISFGTTTSTVWDNAQYSNNFEMTKLDGKVGNTTRSTNYIQLYDDLGLTEFNGLILVTVKDAYKYILIYCCYKRNETNDAVAVSSYQMEIGTKNTLGTINISGLSSTLSENYITLIPSYWA